MEKDGGGDATVDVVSRCRVVAVWRRRVVDYDDSPGERSITRRSDLGW